MNDLKSASMTQLKTILMTNYSPVEKEQAKIEIERRNKSWVGK